MENPPVLTSMGRSRGRLPIMCGAAVGVATLATAVLARCAVASSDGNSFAYYGFLFWELVLWPSAAAASLLRVPVSVDPYSPSGGLIVSAVVVNSILTFAVGFLFRLVASKIREPGDVPRDKGGPEQT